MVCACMSALGPHWASMIMPMLAMSICFFSLCTQVSTPAIKPVIMRLQASHVLNMSITPATIPIRPAIMNAMLPRLYDFDFFIVSP